MNPVADEGLDDLSIPEDLYRQPLAATRKGPLYNAFSYPTKISPESVALFIAAHTEPGQVVLDPFGGTGSTALGALLCSNPPLALKREANRLGLVPHWGPRSAVIYELSPVAAFVAEALCNPPEPALFLRDAEAWLDEAEAESAELYSVNQPDGGHGVLRHAIWTEYLRCPECNQESSLWDLAVQIGPVAIRQEGTCPSCSAVFPIAAAPRAIEEIWDPILGRSVLQRKRRPARIYGRSGRELWSREPTASDGAAVDRARARLNADKVQTKEIPWGDLYRSGYHSGLTHSHHFYTARNLLAMSTLWASIEGQPSESQNALRLLALSYNATHATLLARVVVKHDLNDFALTGAQSGVLYVSGLPVEKNVFQGLRKKATTIARAFGVVRNCAGSVTVVNASSRLIALRDRSVDYVFTDPPFGDFIPYAEVNFLNEVWLGRLTDPREEVVMSPAQGKGSLEYENLLADVLCEVARVLKDDALATVVFHAAKTDVWDALTGAYDKAGLRVARSSFLDKTQGSFKQVTTTGSVRADPTLLLARRRGSDAPSARTLAPVDLVPSLLANNPDLSDGGELALKKLFSRFVGHYLERGAQVPIGAAAFYTLARQILQQAAR